MPSLKYKDLAQQALRKEFSKPVLSRKKTVAFVLPSMTAGGAERVLITLMNNLDRRFYNPVFIAVNGKGPLTSLVDSKIPFYDLKSRKVSASLPKLLKRLNAVEPDIIVSTMAAMNYGILMVKPFLNKKAKIIVREAVVPSSIAESQRFPWAVKSAYRRLYPQADLVISPARCIIDEFRDYLKMDIRNHALLHNPVDMNRIRSHQIIQPVDENRKKTLKFVCAGRLHPQKGFDALINALSDFETDYDWQVNIMGAGPEEARLRTLINDKGLSDRITLSGLVDQPWPVIGAADCFLLPSRWEGLPNVVLEALACGTPVIATKTSGGIAEIARRADPGAVQVAGDYAEMISMMAAVRPRPTQVFRPSLLPEEFSMQAINARFSNLLEGRKRIKPLAANQSKTLLSGKKSLFGRRSRPVGRQQVA